MSGNFVRTTNRYTRRFPGSDARARPAGVAGDDAATRAGAGETPEDRETGSWTGTFGHVEGRGRYFISPIVKKYYIFGWRPRSSRPRRRAAPGRQRIGRPVRSLPNRGGFGSATSSDCRGSRAKPQSAGLRRWTAIRTPPVTRRGYRFVRTRTGHGASRRFVGCRGPAGPASENGYTRGYPTGELV